MICVERPRRPAEALARSPPDRVDVGVEHRGVPAGRRGRPGAEGRQRRGSRRRAARARTAGAMRFHGGTSAARRRAGPSVERRAHPAASSARATSGEPRGAELGRPPARPVGRRRLVVPVRVAVLDDAEPGRPLADRGGNRLVEPGRYHGERERRRVDRRQAEQLVEGWRGGACVVVAPPDGRAAGRPAVELRREALPGGPVPGVRHRSSGASPPALGATRGARSRRRVCSGCR